MEKLNKTKISIGLAIFNEEEKIKRAIEAILNQTHNNFELIISDDCSTDSTYSICQEYANKDERIKLFKQKNNTGVAKNFYFVFKQSLSDYFIWLSGDDVISKNYIESNLKTLLKNSDCSFAASPNCYEGDEIHISKHINFSIKGSLYEKGFFFLKNSFFATGCNFAIYKKEILNKCPNLDSKFLGHDWKVITNSLLYGNFCRSQDGLIVLGKGGLSASNEFLIKERNKFIEYFIPLFEFSKFFLQKFIMNKQINFIQKGILLFFLIRINISILLSSIKKRILYNLQKKRHKKLGSFYNSKY